jgi:hypothetical protein
MMLINLYSMVIPYDISNKEKFIKEEYENYLFLSNYDTKTTHRD